MSNTLHITSGDCAGELLTKSGIPGEVFVWHDVLYDGPREPGWPDDVILRARAEFLEDFTAGGLDAGSILGTLEDQYAKLASAGDYESLVLWFDACVFDQSMLAHILACMQLRGIQGAELLCVDEFPGIVPYHGLGQLRPDQLASVYDQRQPVTGDQFAYAKTVDDAFASEGQSLLVQISQQVTPPLPWVPAAVTRWLQEQPDPETGLGLLETLALEAVRNGLETPWDIFASAAAADTPPQFWGDTTLWAKINALADRAPPLVHIEGPMERLPQWPGMADLSQFRITP